MDSLHANKKEDSFRDLVGSTAIGGVQASDLAFHAAPFFSAETGNRAEGPAFQAGSPIYIERKNPLTHGLRLDGTDTA
jgi:hypothetical protein